MTQLNADLRYALRTLRRSPGFSAVAVAALALGIGANTAIFSVVNAVLLRPLPYPDPDRLVRVCRQYPSGRVCNASIPKFMAWRGAQSLEALAAYDFSGPGLNLGGGERPEQVRGIHVTADYFRVFGATIARGRTFSPEEDAPGGPAVVVLSHGIWVTRFGQDESVLGRTITLNDMPYVVIGVTAQDFHPDPPTDVFIPLQPDPNSANQAHFLLTAGRLGPGVTLDAARAEMRVVGDRFRREHPRWMGDTEQAGVHRMQDVDVSGARPALLILLGAVGLVLLMACANVANLLLVRGAVRQKEIAIRSAIGAGRGAIIRQLIAESLVLSLVGAIAGLVVGVWGAQALLALAPGDLPRVDSLVRGSMFDTVLDGRLLAFTLGLALATGVLFGLAPALHLSKSDLGGALKEGGGRGSTSARSARMRSMLVVGEVALALVLLVGATLLIRTFAKLQSVLPGFEPAQVLTMQTSLAGDKYATTAGLARLIEEVTRRLDALPGVEVSALAISLPTEGGPDLPLRIEGRPLEGDALFHGDEQWRVVSHRYFEALRIPLVRGRLFDERDTAAAPAVVVINADMAARLWPDGDAIGQQITIGRGLGPEFEDRTREVIGIVGDVREQGLDVDAPGVMYVPALQLPDALTRLGNSIVPYSWVIRTGGNPGALSGPIQNVFLTAGGLPVSRVRTMDQVVSQSIASQNFNMLLLGAFGAIALVLAAIGIYGLISYSVEQATHEIGVRVALGAARRDILSMVVGHGMRLAALGVALGLAGALAATRVLSRLLFGVGATDPASFVVVAATLVLVALLACYLPARRAMRIDPIIALRAE